MHTILSAPLKMHACTFISVHIVAYIYCTDDNEYACASFYLFDIDKENHAYVKSMLCRIYICIDNK